ncbi:MAG: DUF1573 domain-containing protein [Planctomycetota bacterium]
MLGQMYRWAVVVAMLATGSPRVMAQSTWADALVDTRKMDFGVIATGSEAVKIVVIENKLTSPVHLSSVSTACKCAQAKMPEKTLLAPGEKTTVEVQMNTLAFSKQRDTSLSIYFDAPQFAEVRIPISAYIRTDVVFDPGKVDFGVVDFLAGATRRVRISYAGRPDWTIRDVKISGKGLSATLKEISRQGGSVAYDLEMNLAKDARPGRLRDIVTLITDDAANPYVPLIVEGEIVPDIRISKTENFLGRLRPGQTTTVRLVVNGKEPFLVEDVDCKSLQDCFKVKMSDKENRVQIVNMEFTAPETPGKFEEELVLRIKGREEVYRFTVSGSIN